MITLFNALFGLLLLIAGRNLFWVSVGVVGFLVGADLATNMMQVQNEWIQLLIAFCFGVVGAFLALALEWIAILLMGFWGGGYLLMKIFSFAVTSDVGMWGLFIIGGIIGIIAMLAAFDLVLITLTSLIGGMLVADPFKGNEPLHTVVYAVAAICGVLVQSTTLRSHSRPPTTA